jgi:membrane protease YdiL (CAAX protease family)
VNSQIPQPAFPAPRLNAFLRLLIAVAGCVAIQTAVVTIVAAGVQVAASMQGLNPSSQTKNFFSENLLLINLFIYPPTLLWLWFCRRFFDRRAFISLGLHARHFFAQFSSGLLCGFLSCALIFGVLLLTGHAHVTGWSLAAQSGGIEKSLLLLLAWMAVMLCVGFMEEIGFRGYAFHNLAAWLGVRAAIAIQAVAFALIHLGNLASRQQSTPDAALATWLAMPNIALIGIFFVLCYLKTGSLWFPIAFHAAWNFFLGCVFSFPVSGIPIFRLFDVQMSGSTFITGGSFGPEASLLLTPILLAMNFVIARAPDHRQATFDLQSLRSAFALNDQAQIPTLTTVETEAERANRFKTRMGKATRELDADTTATLRALNEQSKRNAQQRTESAFSIAAAASCTPSQSPVAAAQSTPRAPKINEMPNAEPQNAEPPVAATLPATAPIPTPQIPTPVAPSAPVSSTPIAEKKVAPPASRKEKPRW